MKRFTNYGGQDYGGQELAGASPSPHVEALSRALDASGCFHRDSRLGRIYHRGAVSYRELRPIDSFHVVIEGSRVSVHVDRISPLKRRPDGSVRLSLTRVLAHNLAGFHGELTRRVRRPDGPQRGAVDPAQVLPRERS